MNQTDLFTTIKHMLVSLMKILTDNMNNNKVFYRQHEELFNPTTMSLHLSEDTKVPKEETNMFQ